MTTKKICMLASGGDAPGMNACMEAIFNYSVQRGIDVWVARMGYDGILNEHFERATRDMCSGISHLAGCVYRCGRSPEFGTPAGTKKGVENLKKHNFDALIVIGGDGSLRALERIKQAGINVIGIPASVDNDCYFTSNSLGFASAAEAITQYVDRIKPTMLTNERSFMVNVFGKGCSELAVTTAVSCFANFVDRSEKRLTAAYVSDLFNAQRAKGNCTCIGMVEEKRKDLETFLEGIKMRSPDNKVRLDRGEYYQRGAVPCCRDRILAAHYGVKAVDLIIQGTYGVVIGMNFDEIITQPLEEANRVKPQFNETLYNLISKISNW
jgi:6-phosphofructokinase 1